VQVRDGDGLPVRGAGDRVERPHRVPGRLGDVERHRVLVTIERDALARRLRVLMRRGVGDQHDRPLDRPLEPPRILRHRVPGIECAVFSGPDSDHGDIHIEQLPRNGSQMRAIRGAEISMIFQDPMTALNPVFTIGSQIEETLQVHGVARRRAARERAVELLEAVSIPEPQRRVHDYPHQLSGGLRQRALIALALSCNPSLLIADEPTTALDVTIQAQILDLLRDLQQRFKLSVLLITHDLGVVAEMADRVAVMYAGRIVEEGLVRDLFRDPRHPYTRGLLASIPGGTRGARLQAIQGTVPPLGQLPPGCAFAPRCPHRFEPCDKAVPGMTQIGDLVPRGFRFEPGEHMARCYLYSPAIEPQVLAEVRREKDRR